MSKKNNPSGIVYSTDPDFHIDQVENEGQEILPPEKQNLIIELDKRNRSGKSVTLISGFISKESDLNDLAKYLKTKCGSGGSLKDNEIIIQGDFREKLKVLLVEKGYRVKVRN